MDPGGEKQHAPYGRASTPSPPTVRQHHLLAPTDTGSGRRRESSASASTSTSALVMRDPLALQRSRSLWDPTTHRSVGMAPGTEEHLTPMAPGGMAPGAEEHLAPMAPAALAPNLDSDFDGVEFVLDTESQGFVGMEEFVVPDSDAETDDESIRMESKKTSDKDLITEEEKVQEN